MIRSGKYVLLTLTCVTLFWVSSAFDRADYEREYTANFGIIPLDSPDVELIYPIGDPANPFSSEGSSIDFDDPLNFQNGVVYDPATNAYIINNSVGDGIFYQAPQYMTLEEYIEYDLNQFLNNNWDDLITDDNESEKDVIPTLNIDSKKFADIFGEGGIDIRPTGTAELQFGINTSRTDNPQIPVKQRRITVFDFNERIQLNVVGTIGDKLKLSTSYNTEATFDFENQMKLEYKGYEDEIIQSIEAGNVSLPLSGSLITGSQSLFGLKSELKFGRLTVTSVFSQQKGKRSEVNVAGGAQVQQYEIKADNYEANKHYFLTQDFRARYDRALQNMPIVNSQINITRIEVWVTNLNNTTTDTRNIVALTDLGEHDSLQSPGSITTTPGAQNADNSANNLYANTANNTGIRGFTAATTQLQNLNLRAAVDFEKIENARRLTEQEFTYNALLGYISLNQSLNNDEILAVAFQYTIGGQTYQVGEFSTDGISGQDALILKLLKPTITNPKTRLWDLMMKNIYAIGAYQVAPADFQLNIWYNNPATSVQIPFLPYSGVDDVPLIQILGLDKLNQQNAAFPDGYFDFVPIAVQGNKQVNGGTINPQNGRVMFTTIEPFGATLYDELTGKGMSAQEANLIAFKELYDSTKTIAQNTPSKNRFFIKGSYQSSSSSEISLNALNIPRGAVTVTSGGNLLQENVDYTVDYNLGRVKIINDGLLQSQAPIKVSVESNSLFNIQTKTLLGTNFDYRISEDANIGGTIMRLSERPLTQKVEVNDEPIKNTQIGMNGNLKRDLPLLTKLIDKLPFIETKEKSTLTFGAEAAVLIPGHSRAIGKDGVSYIDDFEGSQSAIDIRSFSQWQLASVPKGQPDLFPEGDLNNDLAAGFGRALISRYVIDPLFFRNNNLTPSHIQNNPAIQFNHNMREVLNQEVFPNQVLQTGVPNNIPVFDIAYYPTERGPYNFDDGSTPYGDGLNSDGTLVNPDERWGGIMRSLNTNDFEAANIEFIQFWMMDPFNADADPNGTHQGGDLYFNLGNISEDILPDSRKAFENGIPVDGTQDDLDQSVWGQVPTTQVIVQAFDNDPSSREFQDVGYDLLNDNQEVAFYSDYVNWVNSSPLSAAAKAKILDDVANDNYKYYLGTSYNTAQNTILERYKRFALPEGNSNTSEQDEELANSGEIDNNITTSATNMPDIEDINRDNNLSESESYFQYRVSLRKQDMQVGRNFITDVLETFGPDNRPVKWYQFKIPVRSPSKVVNGISDFRSIRFIRMFMKGWNDPAHLRFARLELIRGEWRRYFDPLLSNGEYIQDDPDGTLFNVGAVNVEQNGNRQPIPYIVPPGITREIDVASANLRQLNEQSLSLQICGLKDGDARAAYKNLDLDVRQYKRLKMFVHGEYADPDNPAQDDDVTVFVRLGTDYTENYYEYEMPVKMTQWDATASAEEVWPDANNIEIIFDSLKNTKLERDRAGFATNQRYTRIDPLDPERRMAVIGNPNLAGIKTIMIGVRNPHKDQDNPWKPDDGEEKCVEVWVNELRLADFDENGGYAALSRVSVKGADFMRLDLSGSLSTPGWGSIEKRVSERQRETIRQFDASASFELGKFFNKDLGLRIPLFLNYSVSAIDPQFDPLNPDILWETLSQAEQQERAPIVRNYSQSRAFNLTNVSKARAQGKKPHFWDIENWSATYAYNEMFRRDVNTKFNKNRTYRGGLYYAFNANPKLWQPFKDNKLFKKSKWFGLVRDFGFYLGPKQLSFKNDIMRTDNENLIRSNFDNLLKPQFNRQFTWNRGYDFKYDVTKNIKFDFHAVNNSIIEEPLQAQSLNRDLYPIYYDEWKDTVMESIRRFGETMNYGHNSNVNVTLPFDKFPLTDWINLTAGIQTSYDWNRAPLAQDTLGNTIQNSRNVRWSGQFNMTSLYNKVPYLRKVNQKIRSQGRGGRGGRSPRVPAGRGRGGDDDNKDDDEKDDKEKKKDDKQLTGLDYAANFLMMLKNVSFQYSTNDGLMLPGYAHGTQVLGMNSNWTKPGWGFIMGQQNYDLFGDTIRDIAMYGARNDWMIDTNYSKYLNAQHTVNHATNFSGRATLEPIPGMRIELSASKDVSVNTASNFRYDDSLGRYAHQNMMETGSMSVSAFTLGTAFTPIDDKTYDSQTFQNLRQNRELVSAILGEQHPNSDIHPDSLYYDGYNGTQQEVVVGAFISAYSGKNPDKDNVNPFSAVPLPNWRFTYDGLSKIPAFKDLIQRLSITHAYRSQMTIAGYTTNLEAQMDNGIPTTTDLGGNFISDKQFTTVTITEQLSPLIGFDATWKLKSKGNSNGLITKFEIKKDRNIALSLSNYQVTEILGNELVIGSGYKFSEVPFPFKIGGDTKYSDLNLRVDLSIRSNRTITRKIVEDQNQITSGQRTMSIKCAADYQLSKALNLRFYFDKVVTNPFVSTTFPTANTNAGLALRFTLAQ